MKLIPISITLSFICFAGFILTCVYITTNHTLDLVSQTYYQDELQYQTVIDGKNNAANLKTPLSVETTPTQVVVTLNSKVDAGTILFYRSDNAKQDLLYTLKSDNSVYTFDKSTLVKGLYTLKIKWTADSKPYYVEKTIRI